MLQEEEVVREVFASWEEGKERTLEVQARTWDEEVVWWNSARGTLRGRQSTSDAVANMFDQTGAAKFVAEDIKTLIAQPGQVVVERVDTCYTADGDVISAVPVVGILTFKDGKIIEWRDYCDDWMREHRPDPEKRSLV